MRIIAASYFVFLLCLPAAAQSTPPMLTGTDFPNISDFPNLGRLGYNFALTTLDPSQPKTWAPLLDAAQAAGIKLIVGPYPPPFTENAGIWTISSAGMDLLTYLQSRSSLLLALYVFNEPYSTNPATNAVTPCGYYSAADLRTLRSSIQAGWPSLKIYQDLGAPSGWIPGSAYVLQNPCVGDKYADQTGVADYVGIWYYPFTSAGYNRDAGIAALTSEANFVLSSMQPGVPVNLNQAFACAGCPPGLVYPTPAQVLDWNCAMRALPFAAVDWYPWQPFSSYTEAMADTPADWPLTTAAACNAGMGSGAVALSSASGMPFVAPGSFVSVYGSNFASISEAALSLNLPPSLGGTSLQIQDSSGNTQAAAIAYVSPSQVNFVMPAGIAAGQASLALSNGSTSIAGTALVSNVAPALFSADGSGTGAAAATAIEVASNAQQTAISVYQCTGDACTAVPLNLNAGEPVYLTLYGTGIRNYVTAVDVSINGIAIPVLYAGPQGTYEGLDQINVGPLPASLSGGGNVTIALTVDGLAANAVTVDFE